MTKTPETQPIHEESTYQLLVRSEERERVVFEDIVYLLLIVAALMTIWQFGNQPMTTLSQIGVNYAQHLAALANS